MNSQHQEYHEEVDFSNFMLLVDVCCQKAEEISDRWKVFRKRKRTKFLPSLLASKLNANPNSNPKKDEESLHVIPLPLPPPLSEDNKFAKGVATNQPASESKKRKQSNHDQEESRNNTIEKATATTQSKSKIKREPAHDDDQEPPVQKKKIIERPAVTPIWVEQVASTQLHNAQPPVWLCGKELTVTDAKKHHNRFFIPKTGVENLFQELTQGEKKMVPNGIPVIGLDEDGRVWNLELKLWPGVKQHVLSKRWIDLVQANHLKGKDEIQVWFCRYGRDRKFCFLIGRK
ncbi:hypothetical protein MRB53_035078 [Persea americana]|uniref:Uncharacterized protein n=1 Tax=Persea americana TaxID=3435 RepID=A0ACC2K3N8_PERAE|nr:hypothetical protein MRB53_035078 [Persea americana]